MKIVAMDLGKSKTVVCYYDTEENTHRFKTIVTRPQALHDAIIEMDAQSGTGEWVTSWMGYRYGSISWHRSAGS